MTVYGRVSSQTSRNWLVDTILFSSALLASLSGIYFLFLPVGGYQGGRNPWYGAVILFTRETWDLVHTWSGVAMIAIAVLHLTLHWSWVVNMTRRAIKELCGQCGSLNARGRFNVAINLMVAISFFLSAVSGVYFLFFAGGRWMPDPALLFSRSTWDLIHTWSGVVLISAAVLHFAIHWKWVTKVTRKMFSNKWGTTSAGIPAHSER